MKTFEEGYAMGWADAIYKYESKQRENMSTIDDLMALADDWANFNTTRESLRTAIESALAAEYERAHGISNE